MSWNYLFQSETTELCPFSEAAPGYCKMEVLYLAGRGIKIGGTYMKGSVCHEECLFIRYAQSLQTRTSVCNMALLALAIDIVMMAIKV